jgi:DNA-binding IclR family transcriptional regulator
MSFPDAGFDAFPAAAPEGGRYRVLFVDDEENVLGVRCFALPLRLGKSAGDAVSCSVPIERLDGREAEIVSAIRRTVVAIERMVPVAS